MSVNLHPSQSPRQATGVPGEADLLGDARGVAGWTCTNVAFYWAAGRPAEFLPQIKREFLVE